MRDRTRWDKIGHAAKNMGKGAHQDAFSPAALLRSCLSQLAKPIGFLLTSPLFIANLSAVRKGSEIGTDDELLWGFPHYRNNEPHS
jgi:hypothetical protein